MEEDAAIIPHAGKFGLMFSIRLCCVSSFILLSAWPGDAAAGVRHELYVTMSYEPSAAHAAGSDTADLTLDLYVSSHSVQSSFSGQVSILFSGQIIPGQDKEKLIWRDSVCHQDRGLPKVSPIFVSGTMKNGDNTTKVNSYRRQIGKKLPKDEICVFRTGVRTEAPGYRQSILTLTTSSRIFFRVKTVSYRCVI